MGKDITFREIKDGEESRACHLVMESFNEFVAPGYSEEGVTEFSKYLNPQFMQWRLANNHFVLVALDKDVLIGIIEVRNDNHISLLFVKKAYHKRGISKKVLEMTITKCRQYNANNAIIEVNSSPFAVPVYEKMGFVKTNTEQIINGIRFIPMTRNLS